MTHLDLPEQWRWGSTDLSTYAYLVREVTGVDEFPPVRGDNILVPSIRGQRWASKQYDQRRISLALWVNSMAADGSLVEPTQPEQTRTNLDALYALLSPREQGSLVRVMPDGSERTATAEVVQVGMITDPVGHAAIGMIVDFLLADPWFYGAAVNEPQAVSASPTDFAVTNPGTVDAHGLLLTLHGPLENPRLSNLTIDSGGDYYLEILVAVAGSTDLIVDCGAWTAENDGVNAIGSVRHSGGFEFMRLVPGSNSLRVETDTTGGSLEIDYSPPYI